MTDLEEGVNHFELGNYLEAKHWLLKVAEQGNANAQYYLGLMYGEGRGVAQHYNKAVSWYTKAANQDHAQAQNNLGLMYAQGRGVTQNDNAAVSLYLPAAEKGNTDAQYYLGLMCKEGRGFPQGPDLPQAHKWLNIASALGDEDAKNGRWDVEKEMTPQQISNAQNNATAWLETYRKRRQ